MVPDINNLVVPLKYWRKRLNWSVNKLAALASVSTATIAKIEKGGYLPRQDVIERLSEAMSVPVSKLIVDKAEAARLESQDTDEEEAHHLDLAS